MLDSFSHYLPPKFDNRLSSWALESYSPVATNIPSLGSGLYGPSFLLAIPKNRFLKLLKNGRKNQRVNKIRSLSLHSFLDYYHL